MKLILATRTYNRTVEELKLIHRQALSSRITTYNRTVEELKWKRAYTPTAGKQLIIAP